MGCIYWCKFFITPMPKNCILATGYQKPSVHQSKEDKQIPLFHNHKGTKNCIKGTKRGTNFWQMGIQRGPFLTYVKGDLKFEFFRFVHKQWICWNSLGIKLKFPQRRLIFTCRAPSWSKPHFYLLLNGLQMIRAAIILPSSV